MGGTSQRWARWGPKLQAGKLGAGSRVVSARLNAKRWGPNSCWERRGGDPQNLPCVSPPGRAGRAEMLEPAAGSRRVPGCLAPSAGASRE